MATTIESIQRDLKKLTGSVLSIYLNTNPSKSDWKIRLKNGLKRTKEYLEASEPHQVKLFTKISKKVEQKIKDRQLSFTNSFICFASSDQLFLYHLQIPVENDFKWQEKQADSQLFKLFKQYPKSGVILLQHDKITLITSLLGELIQEKHYLFDVKTKHWKQYKRFSFGYTYSGGNPKDKYVRRFRENQARWYKSIIPTIERYSRQQGWENVYLAGPAELRKILKQHLNVNVTGETTRNYSGKPAHAILHKTILATP